MPHIFTYRPGISMMTSPFRRTLVALALCLPCVSATLAANEPVGPEVRIEAAINAAQVVVQQGPRDIALGDQGVLRLPDGFGFIPKAEAEALMAAQGNHAGPGFMGLIVGPDLQGFLAVEFSAAGYVKDEDAREWDAAEMLDKLKAGTEAANEERRQRELPEFSVVGWVEVPSYDPANHRLVWSVAARPKEPRAGGDGVNYNTYMLGREGYFSMNLVTSMDRVELEKPVAREILAALSFNEGKRYADFNASTDRMAEYGLAALVGGLAAKKLGLLATAGVFIAKFWKIGLLAMASAGAGTWLKRKKKSD
ncbi:DUF2167 domain-containing protein [Dokdonella sp.]|uniref:DUF2167 domain-containing protein n=1 Tax=Dokdonella sp. TaxID=2291710 RepID=UPI002DD66865|nr:DUF2167 domain-containing protein [Dokdonella sp.]